MISRRIFGVSALAAAAHALLRPTAAFARRAVKEESVLPPGATACVIDSATGQVLYEKDADTPILIASTTKMMTAAAIFGLIQCGRISLDDKFTVSANGANQGGSCMFLRKGEVISVDQLLRGLMVHSGNDAAVALAEGIGAVLAPNSKDPEQVFMNHMNDLARAWGMENSKFNDTNGLTDKNLSTARDMALLMRQLTHGYPDLYKEYFGIRDFTHGTNPKTGEPGYAANHNGLLGKMGVDGGKTGWTPKAGRSVVLSAVEGGCRVVAALFGIADGPDPKHPNTLRTFMSGKLIAMGFEKMGQKFARLDAPRHGRRFGR